MPRRTFVPTVGRSQAVPAPAAVSAQTALPDALLVPVDQIVPDPGQPRRHFDEAALAELAESIRQEGVLQPLLVRAEGALPDGRMRFVIIAGGRRHRAAIQAGLAAVPVMVRAGAEGTELRIVQLVENLQREELDALEEALAIRELMQLADLSLEGVAGRIGKTKAYVQRRTDLLYDPRLTEAVRRGEINASVAVELRYASAEQRDRYLDRLAAGERLEVAQLREEKRRARAILFGTDELRGGGARALPAGGNGNERDPGRVAGESYRFDTTHPPAAGHDLRLQDLESYRFDTIADGSMAAGPAGGIALADATFSRSGLDEPAPGVLPAAMLTADGVRWAAEMAELLVKSRHAATWEELTRKALQVWQEAGAPPGWGDALLRVLAERLNLGG